jgi:proteasome lid subunit RPN8/RPN11
MDTMNPNQKKTLFIHPEHRDQMLTDIEKRKPEEACGLIAGLSGQAIEVVPISNESHSATYYRMAPKEQLDAFNRFDEKGWELLAIYHSHPDGPDFPSTTDIAEATYSGVIYLVWFPQQGEWHCRGFLIQVDQVTEVPVYCISDETQTRYDLNNDK